MKKIICPRCKKAVVAYIGEKLVEIAYKGKRITVFGKDATILAPCSASDCNERIAIEIRDGIIREEGLTTGEMKVKMEEEKKNEEEEQKRKKEKEKEIEEKKKEIEKEKKPEFIDK